ncbi:MAG: hypothetical protein NVS9B7_00650 [Flavisolibacter sp.]
MDNTYQLNAASLFNLKAYGLVVYLLNRNIHLKWVIKSGKVKDALDFTVVSDLVKPSLTATGLSRDFKAGPFVIFQADTTGVAAMMDNFYTSNTLTLADRPNLYVTKAPVNVDIRYDLTGYIPMGAILTDGGNQAIHQGFMTAAAIPTANYALSTGYNLNNCFSFASEPHNSQSGAVVDTAIAHIRTFVQQGGNFLAECAAVTNYENNPLGMFQTATGITKVNNAIGTTGTYPNADLSFSQFENVFNGSLTGSIQNWQINTVGINNEHNHVIGAGALSTSISASVSKLITGRGGLVFYLGNHSYTTADIPNINGIRMYMNAFMTPSIFNCPSPLPLSLLNFSGSLNKGVAIFNWSVAQNETGDHFELEKSMDGKTFVTVSVIPTTTNQGWEAYTHQELNIYGTAYFRLKMVNKSHSFSYSKIVVIKDGSDSNEKLTLLENPISTSLSFNYKATKPSPCLVAIYNSVGAKILEQHIYANSGFNSFSLSLNGDWPKGIYYMKLANGNEISLAKIVKQ